MSTAILSSTPRAAGFQFNDEEIAEFLDQFDKDGDGQLDQSGEIFVIMAMVRVTNHGKDML